MTSIFVDTSGILALLAADDRHHAQAVHAFERLSEEQARLVTTSYVLVETYALLRNRSGKEATRRFEREFEPLLDVVWVGPEAHRAGLERLEGASRRVSLVDAVSFVVAEAEGIERAFAYDRHFTLAGLPRYP